MRNGTHAEVAAVDGLLDEAVRRGLALRLDSVDQVLMAAAWFLHRWPGENLAVKIREVLTPRPGGYVLTLVPAGELLAPGKVLVFRATAEINGVERPVASVVISIPASWDELERRRAEA